MKNRGHLLFAVHLAGEYLYAAGDGGGEAVDGVFGQALGGGVHGTVGGGGYYQAAVVHSVGEEAATPTAKHVDEGGYAALRQRQVILALEQRRSVARDGQRHLVPLVELLLHVVEQLFHTLVVANHAAVEELLHQCRVAGSGLVAYIFVAQQCVTVLAVVICCRGGRQFARGVGLVVVEVEEEGEHEVVLSFEF